jgi:hypothetical protein
MGFARSTAYELGFMVMKSITCAVFGGLLVTGSLLAAQNHEYTDNPRMLRALYSIRVYDEGCHLGPMPDKGYQQIENEGLKAIPTLLRAITVERKNFKLNFSGPIFVCSCIIHVITDKIKPLNLVAIGNTIIENKEQGSKLLLTKQDKYKFRNEIIKQLKLNNVLSCNESGDHIRCADMK